MDTPSRRALVTTAGGLGAALFGLANAQPAPAPDIDVLLGRWAVDLRATPEAEPYKQWFDVTAVDAESRSFEGRFYDTAIEWARVNRAWGELVLGFVTSDQAGPYHHSAIWRTDARGPWLEGRSQHVGRNLLVPWRARRAAAP